MASDKEITDWLTDHTGNVPTPQPPAKAASDSDIEAWLNDKAQLPQQGGGSLGVGGTIEMLKQLAGKGGPLETPWNRVSDLFPQAGSAIAEGAGQLQSRLDASPVGQAVSKGSQFLTGMTPQELGTVVGTGVSMAPDIAGAVAAAPTVSRVGEIASAGSRIGAAEKAAGIITKAADKYPTSGNVGEVLNTLEDQLKGGSLNDPQALQQAKDIIDYVFQNPRLVGKTKAITVQAARVSQLVQSALNDAVPGRAGAAADFNTLMQFVNPVKTAAKATGYTATGLGTLGAIKHYLMGH